jgi:hypothetical protein
MQSAWPNEFHHPPPFVVHMSAVSLGYDAIQKEMKEEFCRGKDLIRSSGLNLGQPPYRLILALPHLAIPPMDETDSSKRYVCNFKSRIGYFCLDFYGVNKIKSIN